METKTTTANLKLRFSKFLSSITSCKSQNMIPQVITHHQTPTHPHQHDHIFSPLLNSTSNDNPFVSPKSSKPYSRNYPSLCRPRCPETFDGMVRDSARFRYLDYYYHHPVSRSHSRRIDSTKKRATRKRKTKTKTKKKTHLRKGKNRDGFSILPIIGSSNDEDWFSSDDEREDERDALFSSFSSKSYSAFSSDSDSNHPPPTLIPAPRSRSLRGKSFDYDQMMPTLNQKGGDEVKGSFAVMKNSSDPYSDFRRSMVEMIVERQMYGAKELERLLKCFLSLNDECHHRVIVEVFAEILETLFPHING